MLETRLYHAVSTRTTFGPQIGSRGQSARHHITINYNYTIYGVLHAKSAKKNVDKSDILNFLYIFFVAKNKQTRKIC